MKINKQQTAPNFGMSIKNIDKKSIAKNLGQEGLAIVERADRRLKVLHDDTVELTIKGTKGFLLDATKALKVTAKKSMGNINGKPQEITSSFKLWLKPIFSDEHKLNYGNLIKYCENLFYDNPKVDKQIEKINKLVEKGKPKELPRTAQPELTAEVTKPPKTKKDIQDEIDNFNSSSGFPPVGHM